MVRICKGSNPGKIEVCKDAIPALKDFILRFMANVPNGDVLVERVATELEYKGAAKLKIPLVGTLTLVLVDCHAQHRT